MRLELAILLGSVLIAAAILLTNHWAFTVHEITVYRLNRWTGEVTACVVDHGSQEIDRRFDAVCGKPKL